MDPIKLEIPHLSPFLLDIFNDFLQSCYNLDLIKYDSFNLELSSWIKQRMSFDKNGDLVIAPHWPKKYCQCGGFNKHDFVAFQLAGYQLKEAFERGDIEIEITCGKDKFIPAWPKNKVRGGDTKDKIKRAKREWQPKQKLLKQNCPANKLDCRPGYIKICCVCYHKPIMVLRKI
jgi:hypothetical protein